MTNKLWKIIGGFGIMFGLSAGPVLAQGITCFGSVQVGATMSGASISGPGFEFDGLNARSRAPDFGLGAGCDTKIGASPWFIGAFGDYTWRDVSTQITLAPLTINVLGLGNSYTLGAYGGYQFQNGVRTYGLAGVTVSEVSFGLPGLPSSMRGMTIGGGVEIPVMKNVSFVTEVRGTRYEKLELAPGIDLQHDSLSALAKVKLSLN